MPDEKPARELDKIIVRLPDGMRDRLTKIAKANGRSVNAEVVARLQHSLDRVDMVTRGGHGWPTGEALLVAADILRAISEHQPEVERFLDEHRVEFPWQRSEEPTDK